MDKFLIYDVSNAEDTGICFLIPTMGYCWIHCWERHTKRIAGTTLDSHLPIFSPLNDTIHQAIPIFGKLVKKMIVKVLVVMT